jgi:tetratricopeptide (TPR) repeat protein
MLTEARLRRDDTAWFAADAAVLCAAGPESKIDSGRFLPLAERGATEANPDAKQYRTIYLALAQYRAGQFPEALRSLAASDRAGPSRAAPWNEQSVLAAAVRALVLHAADRADEAKPWLATARRRHAAVEHRILIRKFGDEGLPNQLFLDLVRHVLREACRKVAGETFRDDQWRACPRVWGEIQYGRPDRARAAIDGMGPIDPADADLLAARGYLRGLLGDREVARADLEAALRIDPDHLLARLGRGTAALADRPEAAAEDLVAVLKQLPDLRTMDADRLVIDNLLAPADAAFQRAVRLRPADLQLWTARGRYLAWNGRWAEAAEAYAKGMGDRPLFIDWEEYAGALVLAGDLAGYRRLCARLVEVVRSPAGAKGPWGEDGAMQIAAQMVILHPDSGVDPKVYLGWTDALVSRNGNSPFVQFAAGATAHRAGKPDQALGHIRRSMGLLPLWDARELFYYQMAVAHARLGEADEARRWFDLAESGRAAKFVAPRPATVPAHLYANVIIEAEVFRREAEGLVLGKK